MSEVIIKDIVVPVYFWLDDADSIIIDEDAIRMEFEKQLAQVMKEAEGGDKNDG